MAKISLASLHRKGTHSGAGGLSAGEGLFPEEGPTTVAEGVELENGAKTNAGTLRIRVDGIRAVGEVDEHSRLMVGCYLAQGKISPPWLTERHREGGLS